jgi:hypothetical protein
MMGWSGAQGRAWCGGGRSRLLGLAAAPAVALLLTAPGCTARQSEAQYEERLAAALEVRTEAARGLEQSSYTTAAQWRGAADRVSDAAIELDADPPPRRAEAAHDRFLSGMEALAGLLSRRGRCAGLQLRQPKDAAACLRGIDQSAYDTVRNDFAEADSIYREIGFALPGMGGGADDGSGDALEPEGDEL